MFCRQVDARPYLKFDSSNIKYPNTEQLTEVGASAC